MKKLYHQLFTIILVVCFGLTGLFSFGQSPAPEVTVIQPSDAGITWIKGTNNLISWTDNFVKPVDIYLVDYSTLTPTVNEIKLNVTGSTYNWPTNTSGVVAGRSMYRIRVQSSVNGTYRDESEENFSIVTAIPGTYKVNQPSVAGIEWVRGNTYLISWDAGANETVTIELLTLAGTYTKTITNSATGTTKSWFITTDIPFRTDYLIKITGNITGGSAISDFPFSIIETPGGNIKVIQPSESGIEWKRGTTHLISWEDEIPEPVNIKLIDGTASPTYEYSVKTGATGSTYSWPISTAIPYGAHYKIKISSSINAGNYAESEHEFSIVKSLTGHMDQVIQPTATDVWLVNTNHLISWEDEIEETVDIALLDYSASSGTGTPTITSLQSNVSGSTWSWNHVSPVGDYFKIQIKSHTNDDLVMVSDGFFRIVNTLGGGFNQFFQPLGGEHWLRNTTYLISWEDDIMEGVDILLSTEADGGTFTDTYTVLESNVSGSTYLFSTGDRPYGTYNFKLRSTLNHSNEFVSPDFELVQSLGGGITAINQPNEAGLVWVQGTTNLISWDDDLMEPVKIQLCYYGTAPGSTATPTCTDIPGASFVVGTTWSWNIPAGQTPGYYRIQIVSTLPDGPSKLAENEFEIMELIDAAVYPNPCDQSMSIEFPDNNTQNFNIDLFDRFGTRVASKSLNTAWSKQVTLSTSDLPNGVYFLNMTAGDTRISKKVIVQH